MDRQQISRAVDRGQELEDPEDRAAAVRIATAKLAELPRMRRMIWIGAGVLTLIAILGVALSPGFISIAFLVVAASHPLLAEPILSRYIQPRLERARELNAA